LDLPHLPAQHRGGEGYEGDGPGEEQEESVRGDYGTFG
jgi:hypothetical protein